MQQDVKFGVELIQNWDMRLNQRDKDMELNRGILKNFRF